MGGHSGNKGGGKPGGGIAAQEYAMMAGGLNDTMFGMAGAGDWTPRRAEPIRTPLRQPHCAHCGRRIHNPEDDKSCGGCGSREVVMK